MHRRLLQRNSEEERSVDCGIEVGVKEGTLGHLCESHDFNAAQRVRQI